MLAGGRVPSWPQQQGCLCCNLQAHQGKVHEYFIRASERSASGQVHGCLSCGLSKLKERKEMRTHAGKEVN
eukprot:299609-Pelagomonas_calceolata.AAC.4